MLTLPLLNSLEAAMVETPRLKMHVIARGPETGEPVIFVHGNHSAARFFEETMASMPERYRPIAPDMRGYGRTEPAPVDATRGMRDFSDDLYALAQTLGLPRQHLVGWSLGGSIVVQYAIDHPEQVASLTLIAPGSPFGFGGTRDINGTPTAPNYAGSGAGFVNPELVKRLAARDRGSESPFSPRNVMNTYYFKPPFRSPREDVFVEEIVSITVDGENYPGDVLPVSNWPGVGPGTRGANNALSPKYLNQSALAEIKPRPPVLWIRGDSDQIVSDTSLFDVGFLGQIGAIPGWPGPDIFPPQPMVGQMRAVLERYAANGGQYREVVLPDCGHSPHIEKPEAFRQIFFSFLSEAGS